MNKLKFGISGCGNIGAKHAQEISNNASCQLIGCSDISNLGKSLGDKYDVPFYESFEEMLDTHTDMDVISICSPNYCHAPQAIAALKRGHHVLIEKPMALNKAECESIIATSLDTSKKVFCVMQNRYSPVAEKVKGLVSAGVFGQIQMINVQCYWNRDDRYYKPNGTRHPWRGSYEKDGGVLFTQFAHFIDLIYWLFGDIEIKNVVERKFNLVTETEFADSGSVTFETKKERALGNISYTTATWNKNFENVVSIIGSEGTVKITGQYLEKLEYLDSKNLDDSKTPDLPLVKSNHDKVIENVVHVLNSGGHVNTNALDGMKVVEIIEKIYNHA